MHCAHLESLCGFQGQHEHQIREIISYSSGTAVLAHLKHTIIARTKLAWCPCSFQRIQVQWTADRPLQVRSLKAGTPFAALCSAHRGLALTRFISFLAFFSGVTDWSSGKALWSKWGSLLLLRLSKSFVRAFSAEFISTELLFCSTLSPVGFEASWCGTIKVMCGLIGHQSASSGSTMVGS